MWWRWRARWKSEVTAECQKCYHFCARFGSSIECVSFCTLDLFIFCNSFPSLTLKNKENILKSMFTESWCNLTYRSYIIMTLYWTQIDLPINVIYAVLKKEIWWFERLYPDTKLWKSWRKHWMWRERWLIWSTHK